MISAYKLYFSEFMIAKNQQYSGYIGQNSEKYCLKFTENSIFI